MRVHDFRNVYGLSKTEKAETAQLKLIEKENRGKNKYSDLDQEQPCVILNNGAKMPLVGLGTWKSEKGEVGRSVQVALECGYRHIDCAAYYENEHEIGEAIDNVLMEGILKRDQLFITSKLWNTDHSKERVTRSCKDILKRLGLQYLDLLLIHWPVTGNVGDEVRPSVQETWQAMESLVEQGLVRSIGVSNFSVKKICGILEYAKIKPAVNQVEVHPFFRNDALINWCKEQGIHVTAYAPLGSPDSAQILGRQITLNLLTHTDVQQIADKYHKNTGQILIKWGLQHGTSVLPKSIKPTRIKSNLSVFDFEISKQDMEVLSSFLTQVRMVDGSAFLNPRGPYKTLEDLWDEPTHILQQ